MFSLFTKRSGKEQEIIRFVKRKFGYSIKNTFYFEKALRHKSVANNSGELSNERLEFLGDAVLDSIIAEFLFIKFPNEDEGYLTKVKSKVVSRRTLGKIASEMGLHTIMEYNKTRSIKLETIEGNALEALVGAIYLDGGYAKAKKCINGHDFNHILEEEIDFKSKLFIWSQKNKLPLSFEVIDEKNEGPNWLYTIVVMINNQEFGRGTGSSKKKAEQVAARQAIELIG